MSILDAPDRASNPFGQHVQVDGDVNELSVMINNLAMHSLAVLTCSVSIGFHAGHIRMHTVAAAKNVCLISAAAMHHDCIGSQLLQCIMIALVIC